MTAAPPTVTVVSVAEVQISIDSSQPPTGRVVTGEGEPAQPFVGWLQLLTILADALQQRPAAPLTPPTETEP
jgi:hypothetical protein